ncbi:MAG: hypothetical protein AAB131_06705 [Actinomycetota bacterium]
MRCRRAPRFVATAGLVGSMLLAVASCGATESIALDDPPVPVRSEVPFEVADTAATAAGGKVDVNSASTSELEEAFEAAGVANARRWAREVDEYRPYPKDPDFAKLRQELGKYNIAPEVLEAIISTLEF